MAASTCAAMVSSRWATSDWDGRAHDADVDQHRVRPGATVDHADPAPGQPGIDAQHPHRQPPRSCPTWPVHAPHREPAERREPNTCTPEDATRRRPIGDGRTPRRRTASRPGRSPGGGAAQRALLLVLVEQSADLVGDLDVGVDVLDVVEVLDRVDQLERTCAPTRGPPGRSATGRRSGRRSRTRCRRRSARCGPASGRWPRTAPRTCHPASVTSSAPASSTAISRSSSLSSPLGTTTRPIRLNR